MFFMTKETAPEGVGFNTFDMTHLIWLFSGLILCVTAAIVYRKLSEEKRKVLRTVLGCIIVGLEIVKDAVAIGVGDFGVGHLPFHLCGINILLIGFDLIKQTKTVRNFLYFFCIPGAMLALLFPNWTVLPCLNFFFIHSFIIHILLVMYPVILVSSGEVKPSVKMMPKSILLLVCMAIPIYFINMLCDTNFMFLMEPETGNPLGLFKKYLGNHLWGFPILLPVVMFIMYLPLFIIGKLGRKNKKPQEEKEKEEVAV